MTLQFTLLIVGLVILSVGADVFVRGATNIADSLGIPPLLIGLTVVAFGTSAPELCVSMLAAFQGTSDIAVGNVLGSNIFNILMIIGISALMTPMKVDSSIIKREMPIMLVVMAFFAFFASSGTISRVEGISFAIGIFTYVFATYLNGRKDKITPEDLDIEKRPTWQNILILVLGLAGLVGGSHLIVESATVIARQFGVSEVVIGITLIAIGTSLPELATTVAAAMKGKPELAIGNAIGSNVFNVLCVLGFTSVVLPLEVNPQVLAVDIWVMLVACIIPLFLMMIGKRVSRVDGVIMVGMYVSYMIYLVLLEGSIVSS